MISLEHALPLLIFLIISFLAFYFVETLILLILNHSLKKYWKFLDDRLMRAVVRHRTLMRLASIGLVVLIIVLLFIFTPLADLLVSGTGPGILRFLALMLITTMLIIYHIGRYRLREIVIAQRIHLLIFIILSLFAFTGIMSAARTSYKVYADAINKAFVGPIVRDIEAGYEKQLEDRLMTIIRQDLKHDKCTDVNYAQQEGMGLTQLVFIRKDPTLAEEKPAQSSGYPLAGKECIHQIKLLLTPEGKWYQVLEQSFE